MTYDTIEPVGENNWLNLLQNSDWLWTATLYQLFSDSGRQSVIQWAL